MAPDDAPSVTPADADLPAAGVRDDLIFDIGMNTCQDTDFYLKKGFRVVAVEADSQMCRAAEARYPAEVASGQLTVLNRAVSETRDPLVFYICHTESAWSTASPRLRDQWRRQGAEFSEIEVPGVTTADLLAEHGVPRYAKIDIEGFDLVCLRGFDPAAAPPFVSVEVDFYALDELIACAQALGYRRFVLVGQSGVEGQHAPADAREGRAVDYRFTRGCSGLFGEELAGPWMDAERLRAECRKVIQQYRFSGLLSRLERLPFLKTPADTLRHRALPLACDWYDVHAAR